jgi:hypothetical protein
MKKSSLVVCLLIFLCILARPAFANNFDVTTDFSKGVGKDAAGGGGCAGTLVIQKIVSAKESVQVIEGIYLGKPFVEDSQCDIATIVISINGLAYPIHSTSKTKEHANGFMSSYANKKENLSVSIAHVKTIKSEYDADTECTTYNRRVKLDILFKGTRKTFSGITGSGCP